MLQDEGVPVEDLFKRLEELSREAVTELEDESDALLLQAASQDARVLGVLARAREQAVRLRRP